MHIGLLLSCSAFATAASLWSSKSASWDTTNEAFVLGNGKLGGELVRRLSLFVMECSIFIYFSDAIWDGGHRETQPQLR
jgi:hypothetical protein